MSSRIQQISLSQEVLTLAAETPKRPDVQVFTHGDCMELKRVYAKVVTLSMLLTNERKVSVDGVEFCLTGDVKMVATS
jgi:hypothetical protein